MPQTISLGEWCFELLGGVVRVDGGWGGGGWVGGVGGGGRRGGGVGGVAGVGSRGNMGEGGAAPQWNKCSNCNIQEM